MLFYNFQDVVQVLSIIIEKWIGAAADDNKIMYVTFKFLLRFFMAVFC